MPAAVRVKSDARLFENDWLECIIALPDKLFFNTSNLHLYLDLNEPKIGGATGQDTTDQRG